MLDTRTHPVTGQTLRRGVRMHTVSYGGRSEEVEVPGWYPSDPVGDGIHTGTDLAAEEEALKRLKAEASRLSGKGYATGREMYERLARPGPPLETTLRGLPKRDEPHMSVKKALDAIPQSKRDD